jgi:hypothetical protein
LALVPVQAPSSSEPKKRSIRPQKVKEITEAKKPKKGATKRKKSNGAAASNKGKKISAGAASTPFTLKKCKKTSATSSSLTPSIPSKCLPVTVPHDSPAMGLEVKRGKEA